MSENSAIEWTDQTFNPWEGCQKVGPGCDACYAETRNARYNGGTAPNWGPGAPRRKTSASNWQQPIKWNAKAKKLGITYRVFCASLADVFDNAVPAEWRQELAALIKATPHLIWMLLTKRIGNAADMLAEMFPDGVPSNVWLGATIVNQAEADRDIPKLLNTPAAVRFLSMEPLLGPVDLYNGDPDPRLGGLVATHTFVGQWWQHGDDLNAPPRCGVDWVIVGGESGTEARPLNPNWVRSLRDQCLTAEVPFFFKQWGEWRPTDGMSAYDQPVRWVHVSGYAAIHPVSSALPMVRVGKKAAGNLLDGKIHHNWPEAT